MRLSEHQRTRSFQTAAQVSDRSAPQASPTAGPAHTSRSAGGRPPLSARRCRPTQPPSALPAPSLPLPPGIRNYLTPLRTPAPAALHPEGPSQGVITRQSAVAVISRQLQASSHSRAPPARCASTASARGHPLPQPPPARRSSPGFPLPRAGPQRAGPFPTCPRWP